MSARLREAPAEPKTHDYTRRYWGHDYAVVGVRDRGAEIDASGWGHGIAVGDYLLLVNGAHATRYAVKSIEYLGDPSDMWRATLTFAPRSAP